MNRQAWLAQVVEETREPDLPICDPHHHLWDHPGSRYLLDELLQDCAPSGDPGHNVRSTVFVECASMYNAYIDGPLNTVGETEFVQGIAAQSASGQYGDTRVAAGIVSHADLSLGHEVRAVLQRHLEASPNRFKGIRHATGWHASPDIRNAHSNPPQGLMLDEQFREGFDVLDDMGLSFDAWFYHEQLSEFIDLAKTFPNVTIILDHFGGPLGIGPYQDKLDDVYKRWQENIEPLRDCKNVFFKLGGINMKVNGFDWHKQDQPPTSNELVERTARYYEYCINHFGSERCMFESNFPVDKESCSYQVVWNAFKKLSQHLPDTDRANLFHDTAAKVYRLQP